MVNMTHNTDNRRPGNHILFVLFVFLQQFFNDIHLNFFFADNVIINGDIFRIFIGNFLIQGNNLALQKQLLDDCGRQQLHFIGQFLNGDGITYGNNLDLLLLSLFLLRLRLDKSAGLVFQFVLCRIVLFVNKVFPGAFIPLLAAAALLFIPVLLAFFNRAFGDKTLAARRRLPEFIVRGTFSVRPSACALCTVSLRTVTIAARSAAICITVKALARPLAAAKARTALAFTRSALRPVASGRPCVRASALRSVVSRISGLRPVCPAAVRTAALRPAALRAAVLRSVASVIRSSFIPVITSLGPCRFFRGSFFFSCFLFSGCSFRSFRTPALFFQPLIGHLGL